jgi:nitrate/nitrite transport system substrate-binding protein
VTGCKLGYIALTDSAPLIIALEKGLFAKHGMPDVLVEKQASWGATRDNMALGSANGGIDGGHILRPKVHLYSTGKVMQNNQPLPMYTLLNLNEDCQGLSVTQAYADTGVGLDSAPLKEVFAAKRAAGQEVPVAMTFPGGTHDLWMRYWLAAGGIDPTKDVDLIVVPPPQMVANMKVGNMEAFCVGEPWNEQLVNQGIGFTAATTGELWNRHPEKVLGMRADWVDANPNATIAMMMAVMEAQIWCDDAANKDEMAEIIGRRSGTTCPWPTSSAASRARSTMATAASDRPDLAMKFWGEKGETSFPWKSLDTWFITENKRWGTFPGDLDTAALVECHQPQSTCGCRRRRAGPDTRLRRQPRGRDLLRRQDLRSGRPGGLPRQPVDQGDGVRGGRDDRDRPQTPPRRYAAKPPAPGGAPAGAPAPASVAANMAAPAPALGPAPGAPNGFCRPRWC